MDCLKTTLVVWALLLSAAADARDTIPPSGRLLSPESYSVISSNTLLLRAEASDSQSGVKEVRFFLCYKGYVDKLRGSCKHVATVTVPPWEYYFDCSGIPDQDQWRMQAFIEIEDRAGNIAKPPGRHGWGDNPFSSRHIILDRTQTTPNSLYKARYGKKRFRDFNTTADSVLFNDSSFIHFSCGDNHIVAAFWWDRLFFHAYIDVRDQHLTADPAILEEGACTDSLPAAAYINDCIELFFDPHLKRSPFRDTSQKQIIINATGHYCGLVSDVRLERNSFLWNSGAHITIRRLGTLNINSDQDTGYVIQASIPWKALGISARRNLKIGFDIYNNDEDNDSLTRVGRSWAGNERSNYNNSSEWGTILLTASKAPLYIMAALVAMVLLAGSLILWRTFIHPRTDRQKISAEVKKAATTATHPKIKAAIDYLNKNYGDSQITITVVAREVGLNDVYFGSLFRKETGMAFNTYLNNLRIQKALELLEKDPLHRVTDLAFDTGFGTVEHFRRIFKQVTGESPKKFAMKKHESSQSEHREDKDDDEEDMRLEDGKS